jgi:hypothetical protein
MNQSEIRKLRKRIKELEHMVDKLWESSCVLVEQLEAYGPKKIYDTRKGLRTARRREGRKP